MAAAQSNEEIFVDAFSQAGSFRPESDMLRSSRVYEKVHAFTNVSALVAVLVFVAVQRNKSIDFTGAFLEEHQLRTAFETLCQ